MTGEDAKTALPSVSESAHLAIDNLTTIGPALDDEITRFPATYGRQCELLHNALTRLASAKQHAEATTARLQLTVRKSAEIAGVKTTEKKIESEVMQTQEWSDSRDQLVRAELDVERYKLTLRALERKERMLDLLGRKAIREMDAHRVL